MRTAIIAAEVENSLWIGKDMPHFGKGKPVKGFPHLIGFARSHKVPTIIVKKEDFAPLKEWQARWKVPVYIFHIFYDAGYFLAFDKAQEYVRTHVVEPTTQTFYAPGGPTTKKDIFKFWYTLATPLGVVTREPTLTAKFIKDKNGHILPYVFFSGGRLELSEEILGVLRGRSRS